MLANVKWSQREVDHSHSPTEEVKNAYNYTTAPLTLHDVVLNSALLLCNVIYVAQFNDNV